MLTRSLHLLVTDLDLLYPLQYKESGNVILYIMRGNRVLFHESTIWNF